MFVPESSCDTRIAWLRRCAALITWAWRMSIVAGLVRTAHCPAACEKLRGVRLTKAAEIVETAVHETPGFYTFRRGSGGESAPITRWNASCARSDGAPVLSARSRTASRRSTLPAGAGRCATSPAPLGRPNVI